MRQANSSNSGEARGADRVLRLMGRLGDTVKNVNYKFTVTGLGSGDADVIDTNGVVHSVGGAGKVSDINAIADTTRELQRLRAWAGDDATIKFWYDGEGAGLDAIRAIAAKYNIDVEVLP